MKDTSGLIEWGEVSLFPSGMPLGQFTQCFSKQQPRGGCRDKGMRKWGGASKEYLSKAPEGGGSDFKPEAKRLNRKTKVNTVARKGFLKKGHNRNNAEGDAKKISPTKKECR